MSDGDMTWWGEPWGAALCGDGARVDTPIGARCAWCDEAILAGEHGVKMGSGEPIHRECLVRMTVGSVTHQQGLCSCFGGVVEDHPDGVSKRESAISAYAWFVAGQPRAQRARVPAGYAKESRN